VMAENVFARPGRQERLLSFCDCQINRRITRQDKKLRCRRETATIRVIEYFAKSLKVIRNDTVR